MAKYKIVNKREGDRYVNCRVLNENAGDYIVQFDDKSIKSVPAGNVSSLNRIDEGVLDKVKGFGNKILSGFKKIGKWVKAKIGNEYVETSHPVNCFELFRDMPGACFHPSDAVRELADELGIDSSDINNYDVKYDAESKFGIKWLIKKFSDHNSKRSPYRKLDAMNEDLWSKDPKNPYRKIARGYELETDEKGLDPKVVSFYNFDHSRFKGSEIKNLADYYTKGTFTQSYEIIDYDTLWNYLNDEINRGQHEGFANSKSSICIWGAPGIGKTDIIKTLYEDYKETNSTMSYVYVNLAPMNKRDLVLSYFEKEVVNGKERISAVTSYAQKFLHTYRSATSISDIPEECLNLLKYSEDHDEERCVKAYNALKNNEANGGRGRIDNGEYIEEVVGDGGIMFFDEISRCDSALLSALMTFISERSIANQTVGDKWMFIFAGNSLDFMNKIDNPNTKTDAAKVLNIDKAVGDRFLNYVYIPTYESWKNYMMNAVPGAPEEIYDWLRDNPLLFLEDIRDRSSFLPNEKQPKGDTKTPVKYLEDRFKEVYLKNDPNNAFIFKTGNPRNWTAYIKAIIRYMNGEGFENVIRRDRVMQYMALVFERGLKREDFGFPVNIDNPVKNDIIEGVKEKAADIISQMDDMYGDNAGGYNMMKSALAKYKKKDYSTDDIKTLIFAVETDKYRRPEDEEYIELIKGDITFVANNYVYDSDLDDYVLMKGRRSTPINDWKEIPDDVILKLGIQTVGAHAAANLTLQKESLSQFSMANGKSALNGTVTESNGRERRLQYSDFKGITYNVANNDRICGILGECMRNLMKNNYPTYNDDNNGKNSLVFNKTPEFENLIKYITFLGVTINSGSIAIGVLLDAIRSTIMDDVPGCKLSLTPEEYNRLRNNIISKVKGYQNIRIDYIDELRRIENDGGDSVAVRNAENAYNSALNDAFIDIYNTEWIAKK